MFLAMSVRSLIKRKKQLLEVEDMAIRSGDNTRVRNLKVEINTLLDQETRMWKQRARIQWLSKGDGNTKYFHTWASHWFRKNRLLGIYDSANVWTENVKNIATIITYYYQDLFTTTNPDLSSSVLDQIPLVIIASMNSQLDGPFCASEVADALKQMGL